MECSPTSSSDSDYVTIKNSTFELNASNHVSFAATNDFLTLQNNTFKLGATSFAAQIDGTDALVSSNNFVNANSNGTLGTLTVRGPRSQVIANTFDTVRTGVRADNFSQQRFDRIQIKQNTFNKIREIAIFALPNSAAHDN